MREVSQAFIIIYIDRSQTKKIKKIIKRNKNRKNK